MSGGLALAETSNLLGYKEYTQQDFTLHTTVWHRWLRTFIQLISLLRTIKLSTNNVQYIPLVDTDRYKNVNEGRSRQYNVLKCYSGVRIFVFIVVRIWGWVGGSSEIRTFFGFLKYVHKNGSSLKIVYSDLGVGGWVIGNPKIVRIFKIRTQKWIIPKNRIFEKCAGPADTKVRFRISPKNYAANPYTYNALKIG